MEQYFLRYLGAAILAVLTGGIAGPLAAQSSNTLSQSTQDALLHVVAHEIGHAMLREFDLPVLGPEEDIADDFATIFVYQVMPDRAEAIVAARARQNMADGGDAVMFGEYRSDDQRAGRSVCVLYAQDPSRFERLAQQFGLEGDEASACRDFGTEVARSWRRVIDAYKLPEGARVNEAGLRLSDAPLAQAFGASGARDEAFALLSYIDWHSRVTLTIEECDGSAGWSRNGRRIRICDSYIRRFEAQLAN